MEEKIKINSVTIFSPERNWAPANLILKVEFDMICFFEVGKSMIKSVRANCMKSDCGKIIEENRHAASVSSFHLGNQRVCAGSFADYTDPSNQNNSEVK
jgi:hypothetical protein